MKYILVAALLAMSAVTHVAVAQDRVEIESIVIKGNKEFPQILYIVPWKEMKSKGQKEQTLVLHSLFGDLFDPVYLEADNFSRAQTQMK
jgi:hypothetical protein